MGQAKNVHDREREILKEELEQKIEKLETTLDEERAHFDENMAVRISGWSEKESNML